MVTVWQTLVHQITAFDAALIPLIMSHLAVGVETQSKNIKFVTLMSALVSRHPQVRFFPSPSCQHADFIKTLGIT
jgi:hypothetical protein